MRCEVDLAFELRENQLRTKKMGRIKGEKTGELTPHFG